MELTCCLLADAATVAEGKLYVHGGQWDRLLAPSFPVRHPSLSVVLVFRVEYTEALKQHRVEVELMKDGESKGVGAVAHLEMGHPPGLTHGASQSAPIAIPFQNVQFESPGRYEWVVKLDDEVKDSLPLEVGALVTLPGIPGMAPRRGPDHPS